MPDDLRIKGALLALGFDRGGLIIDVDTSASETMEAPSGCDENGQHARVCQEILHSIGPKMVHGGMD